MDDPTDLALATCTGIGLALCALGACVYAWKSSQMPRRSGMKQSLSDTDLTLILEQSIPSASSQGRRLTPPDDPSHV